MSETTDLDLDPRKLVKALNDIGDESKRLAKTVEDSLGKDAANSIRKLEGEAEKGTTKIQSFFRNLGQRVKEDLKTAFDATGVLTGLKFAKELGEGVRQVFDLEKAFDRLNTRLQLTGKQFQDFKKNVGQKISGTGQKMEDVFPGVEVAAAKGGVKSPEQLSAIGEMLAQAKATTGEGTEALADSVVEILKSQGQAVNAGSFKKTLDALQGTRVQGAFKTAGEAGAAVENISGAISPEQAKKMGLGTREMGGLAAMASRGGAGGQDILKHILQTAAQAGGKEQLNAIFGQQIFKGGKLDVGAMGKIDKKHLGQFSEQAMASATGANQADLSRFLDSMKDGMDSFKAVAKGADETASQFGTASDNLATGVDKFRQGTIEATREIGGSLSHAAHELMHGNMGGAAEGLKDAGKAAYENKGKITAAAAITAGVGMFAGKGLKGLLGKGGLGGIAGGLAGGAAASAAGITPVYVTNASEIRGMGGVTDMLGKAAGGMGGAAGIAGKAGMFGAAASVGVGAALAVNEIPGVKETVQGAIGSAFEALGVGFESSAKNMASGQEEYRKSKGLANDAGSALDVENMAAAVAKGTEMGMAKKKGDVIQFTNPSAVEGRGAGM